MRVKINFTCDGEDYSTEVNAVECNNYGVKLKGFVAMMYNLDVSDIVDFKYEEVANV